MYPSAIIIIKQRLGHYIFITLLFNVKIILIHLSIDLFTIISIDQIKTIHTLTVQTFLYTTISCV